MALDRFLAALAHDLRQPLTVIDAVGQLLLRSNLDANQRRLVERLCAAADRLAELSDELLEAGSAELELQPMDLQSLVDGLARDLLLVHPGCSLQLNLQSVMGEWDRMRLQRVVQNLLENAVVHGQPPVSVSLTREGGQAQLVVENACDEIESEQLVELFEPFRRFGTGGRAGLGLHIARELARAHGGELTSSWSRGTISFTLTLPANGSLFTTPRRHPRAVLDSELEVAVGERVFWVKGRDISQRGLAFVGHEELRVSDQIRLAVYSGSASFSVLGTVRHVNHGSGEVLVGVEFPADLSTAELDLLKRRRPS
jgi:two-component sensor histidine kinase